VSAFVEIDGSVEERTLRSRHLTPKPERVEHHGA
jgi:hypothetical protein